MRLRLILFVIFLLACAAFYLWNSPYHQVRTVAMLVDINAPGDRVWQTLTDLNGYREWNPFLTSAQGTLMPGSTLTFTAKTGNRSITLHPRVVEVEPGTRFSWVDRLISSAIFEDKNTFEMIEVDQSHTRVIHAEQFRGILVGPLWRRLSPPFLAGSRAMNEALKRRCEQAASGLARP